MTQITMRQLLQAGVHFGHRTRYWNPRMAPYIFGARNNIHIINLEETLPLMRDAHNYVSRLAANGGQVMFVGTKRAAGEVMESEAKRCGMPYVTHRWLGGMLTNFKTVKQSIKRLIDIETMFETGQAARLHKKEQLGLTREMEKLAKSLGGIKEMTSLPDALFIVDIGYEKIAIQEAKKLGIPVIAVVDTNCSPDDVDIVIPGNDDAIRAIRLYAQVIADAVIDGRGTITTGKAEDDKAAPKAEKKAAVRTRKKAEPEAEAAAEEAPAAEAAAEAPVDAAAPAATEAAAPEAAEAIAEDDSKS